MILCFFSIFGYSNWRQSHTSSPSNWIWFYLSLSDTALSSKCFISRVDTFYNFLIESLNDENFEDTKGVNRRYK